MEDLLELWQLLPAAQSIRLNSFSPDGLPRTLELKTGIGARNASFKPPVWS
jgi:hypothetical protein